MKRQSYKMFATANDTDLWVLAVDSLMQLVDEATAKRVACELADIENTAHAGFEIIAPRSGYENRLGEAYTVFASRCQQANVVDYVAKRNVRLSESLKGKDPLRVSLADKFLERKSLPDLPFFGNQSESYRFEELARI